MSEVFEPSLMGVVAAHGEVLLVVRSADADNTDEFLPVGQMSPDQARLLAGMLVEAADSIERHNNEVH